jgi:hypothetical protein
MFWGEALPTYTTNVTNPFEKYAVDPRVNLPAYPDYEAESLAPAVQLPQQEAEAAPPVDPVKRKSGKTAKATRKRKSLKGAVAAISVPPAKKKTRRKSSKPWTKM